MFVPSKIFSPPKISFVMLQPDNREMVQFVLNHIKENIGPNYPNLIEASLEKIRNMQDRACELMFLGTTLAGFIIYKTATSNEFADYGIQNGFELKTVCTNEKLQKSLGLIGAELFSQAGKRAIEMGATCIFGTISSNKPKVLKFTLNRGFKIKATFEKKYLQTADEFLVCHENPAELNDILDLSSMHYCR